MVKITTKVNSSVNSGSYGLPTLCAGDENGNNNDACAQYKTTVLNLGNE